MSRRCARCSSDGERRKCVLCGRPYTVLRTSGRSRPHRCPAVPVYDEADRLAAMLDDPEGPTFEELFPDRRVLGRFTAYGLILEG